MVTRFYLRNTSNGTTGLPTTKQSAQATTQSASAVTVNKNMSATIGTAQTNITSNTTNGYTYICRWVSDDVIGQTSIAANTWTFSFGYDSGWGSSDANVRVCIYVWHPGSPGSKIANVCDAVVTQTYNTSETGYKLTIAGSAIASGITAGTDVLCVEFMTGGGLGSGVSLHFYYDGTTAVTTNNTGASSVASYIETPETVTMGANPAVTATTTAKVVTNKFIAQG